MLGLEEVPGWSLDSSSSLTSSGMLLCLLLLPVVWGEKLQQEAEFSLDVVETVTVQENLCVQIPCNFSSRGKSNTSNKIFFMWFWKDKSNTNLVATNDRQQKISVNFRDRFKIGNISNHECSLIIRNAQKFDAGNYIISVKKGKSKPIFEKKVFVNVSDLTLKPYIQVPKTLKSGDQETLICKMPVVCREISHTFLWIGSALSSQSPATRIHTSSKLSFIPKPQDHGTNITCRVTFKRSCVSSESTVQLRVIYPPETPTIQVHQGKWTVLKFLKNESYLPVLEGQSLNLSCTTDSYPAVSLNWTKGKQILTSSQLSAAGLVSLQLHQVGPSDSGEYICQTEDPLKSKKASLVISVQYPPKVFNSSCSWTEEGLLCTCSVQAEPAPSLYWWLGDNPVQGNSSNTTFQMVSTTSGCWTNSSLSFRQKPVPAFGLRCEGKNPHGTQSLSFLLVSDRTTPDTEMNIEPFMLAFFGGGIVICLLYVCFLILRKIRKRKLTAVRTEASETEVNGGDKHLPSEAIPLNLDRILRSKSALRPVSHRITSLTSEEEPELHYACLDFQNLKTPNPQESAYAGTEYAEIKF